MEGDNAGEQSVPGAEDEEDFGYDANFSAYEAPDESLYASLVPANTTTSQQAVSSAAATSAYTALYAAQTGAPPASAVNGSSYEANGNAADESAPGSSVEFQSATQPQTEEVDGDGDDVRFVVDDGEGDGEGGVGVTYEAAGPSHKNQAYYRIRKLVRRGGGAVGSRGGFRAGLGGKDGGRSIFEELSVPVPAQVWLPHEEHATLFDIPLHTYKSKPWEMEAVDAGDYFNFGLQPDSWSRYAGQQRRVKRELTAIVEARKAAAAAGLGGGEGGGGGGGGVGLTATPAAGGITYALAALPAPAPAPVQSLPAAAAAARAQPQAPAGAAAAAAVGGSRGSPPAAPRAPAPVPVPARAPTGMAGGAGKPAPPPTGMGGGRGWGPMPPSFPGAPAVVGAGGPGGQGAGMGPDRPDRGRDGRDRSRSRDRDARGHADRGGRRR